jgi:hypothetical protein
MRQLVPILFVAAPGGRVNAESWVVRDLVCWFFVNSRIPGLETNSPQLAAIEVHATKTR